MAKYHIDSIQVWGNFHHEGKEYCLAHLSAHEVSFFDKKKTEHRFIVTYGLHCFTKDETEFNIPVIISDGRHEQYVCLERYECSKYLPMLLKKIDEPRIKLYQTAHEKFFFIHGFHPATNEEVPYKICVAFFKENRKLRIHVTSAFIAREGEGSPGKPVQSNKGVSLFKIITDLVRAPKKKRAGPKETRNRHV